MRCKLIKLALKKEEARPKYSRPRILAAYLSQPKHGKAGRTNRETGTTGLIWICMKTAMTIVSQRAYTHQHTPAHTVGTSAIWILFCASDTYACPDLRRRGGVFWKQAAVLCVLKAGESEVSGKLDMGYTFKLFKIKRILNMRLQPCHHSYRS